MSITLKITAAGKAAKEKEKELETWLRGLPRMDEMVEDYGIDIPLTTIVYHNNETSLGTTRFFLSNYLPHLPQLFPSSYWTSV